jgi:hypothetical protein
LRLTTISRFCAIMPLPIRRLHPLRCLS